MNSEITIADLLIMWALGILLGLVLMRGYYALLAVLQYRKSKQMTFNQYKKWRLN